MNSALVTIGSISRVVSSQVLTIPISSATPVNHLGSLAEKFPVNNCWTVIRQWKYPYACVFLVIFRMNHTYIKILKETTHEIASIGAI